MAEIRFRGLQTEDLFSFCDVVAAVGIDEFIESLDLIQLLSEINQADQVVVGASVITKVLPVIIRGLPKAKREIVEFLAGCSEWDNGTKVTPEELLRMDPAAFIRLVKDFFTREDISDFLSAVSDWLSPTTQSDLKS